MQANRPRALARSPRLFCPEDISPGAILLLPDASAHHVARVLRLVSGDSVCIFNGDGTEWRAEITAVNKSGVSVRAREQLERTVEAPLHIVLAQAISTRERMELTLQKAVELGVAEIWPLESRRTVVRLRDERASRRVDHWQALVISACEQCGRNRVPEVQPIDSLPDWLGRLGAAGPEARVLLSPTAEQRLRELPVPKAVILLAGPEGGLAPEEQELAQLCGFTAVRLGPRILRTETAALAAISAMHALWGDF